MPAPLPYDASLRGPLVVADEIVPDRRGAVAAFTHVRRNGEWILPKMFRAVAFMGQVTLDLTSVSLAPGTSEITVLAVLGGVNIIVPHSLRVEFDGDAVAGECTLKRPAELGTPSPDAPLLRIGGTALFGALKVRVVDPNAPGWRDRWRALRVGRRTA
jgi:hypothetical protein